MILIVVVIIIVSIHIDVKEGEREKKTVDTRKECYEAIRMSWIVVRQRPSMRTHV